MVSTFSSEYQQKKVNACITQHCHTRNVSLVRSQSPRCACRQITQWIVFVMCPYVRHKWKHQYSIISFFLLRVWLLADPPQIEMKCYLGRPRGKGLLGRHVWACPPAVQVHVTPTLYSLSSHNVTKHCTRHGPLGSGRISHAPNPISCELKLGRAGSRSHIQNLNQISSQSSGIDATLHLTLKWDQVVLVDYRWLITLSYISRDPSPSDPSVLHLSTSQPLNLSVLVSTAYSPAVYLDEMWLGRMEEDNPCFNQTYHFKPQSLCTTFCWKWKKLKGNDGFPGGTVIDLSLLHPVLKTVKTCWKNVILLINILKKKSQK